MCQSKAKGGKRCKAHSQKRTGGLIKHVSREGESLQNSQVNSMARVLCPNCGSEYSRGIAPVHRCQRSDLLVLSPASKVIIAAIRDAGGRPIFVGGSVRDALISGEAISPKDIDIEVYGLEIDSLMNALSTIGVVNEVGKAFSVLKTNRRSAMAIRVGRR